MRNNSIEKVYRFLVYSFREITGRVKGAFVDRKGLHSIQLALETLSVISDLSMAQNEDSSNYI